MRSDDTGPTITGFLGDSDRPGHRRLYLTAALDHYVEFREGQVASWSVVPAQHPPFPGVEATRVTLQSGAEVSYTFTRTVRQPDEFDLDVRAVPVSEDGTGYRGGTWEFATCDTCEGTCDPTCRFTACDTDYTCNTCDQTLCTANCPDGFIHPSLVETACQTCHYFGRCPD